MFAESLKFFRKQNRMTQQELANRLGISKSAISMYENGKREPDFEIEEALADLFNIDIDTLRGRRSTTSMLLDPHEKQVIDQYRLHPELQGVIDKLLDIEQ